MFWPRRTDWIFNLAAQYGISTCTCTCIKNCGSFHFHGGRKGYRQATKFLITNQVMRNLVHLIPWHFYKCRRLTLWRCRWSGLRTGNGNWTDIQVKRHQMRLAWRFGISNVVGHQQSSLDVHHVINQLKECNNPRLWLSHAQILYFLLSAWPLQGLLYQLCASLERML